MKRPHKYGAKPTSITYKGKEVKCASKAEAKRFGELILLERAGHIHELEFHPRFDLCVGIEKSRPREKICTYVGDATYVERGKVVVEDIKGFATPVFKLKAALFRALFPGFQLRVVKA